MTLEVATHISELVPANPDGFSGVDRGDDHIRLIKTVLNNGDLVNSVAGKMLIPVLSTGLGNSYVLDITPNIITDQFEAYWTADKTNTGPAELTVGGATLPVWIGEFPLVANDIIIGQKYRAVFDSIGLVWQLVIESVMSAQTSIVYTGIEAIGSPTAVQNIDWTTSDLKRLTFDKNVTLTFTDPHGASDSLTLLLDGDGVTSDNLLTLPVNVSVVNGSFTVNQDPDWVDMLKITFDGTNYFCRIFEAMRPMA